MGSRSRKIKREIKAQAMAQSGESSDAVKSVVDAGNAREGQSTSITVLSDDQAKHKLARDFELVDYAIRNEWPIRRRTRRKVVEAAEKHVDDPDQYISLAAQRVLISADSVNQRREAAQLGSKQASTSFNVNVGVIQQRLDQLDGREPEYIEWRNDRALRQRIDPAAVGCNGFAEEILGGPASSADPESGGDANNQGS